MELFVIGLSHRTAPVAVRERLAVVPSELELRLVRLVRLSGVREAALLSTCNRMEIYGAYGNAEEALAAVREELSAGLAGGPGDAELGRHLYARIGREALLHLFRVASSLDSLVIGEPQILGQIKDAFDQAVKVGTAGPLLGSVFPRAFRVARKVRRDTAIAQQKVSISSVAVDLARRVWGGFRGTRVLIVGAGKMADLAARVLHTDGATLAVTNRTRSRAEDLAARLGAEVEPWEQLGEALGRADIVITSTGSREPIIRLPLIAEVQRARRGRPLVLIDIAVPRDIEAGAGSLSGVFHFDIDDLQKVVSANLEDRRQEADRAEALVEEEIGRFLAGARGRAAGPTIAALRARCQGVARAEAERTVAGLPGIDERTRRALLAMADAIVAKLLHAPSVALKKESATPEGAGLVDAAHRLFDLPPLEPVAEVDNEADSVASTGEASDKPEAATLKAVRT
jgi:glutamyl-tRNA reductase